MNSYESYLLTRNLIIAAFVVFLAILFLKGTRKMPRVIDQKTESIRTAGASLFLIVLFIVGMLGAVIFLTWLILHTLLGALS